MISLRTHIASLVAIFLSLAVGVALGSGPLQRAGSGDAADLAKARQELAAAKQQRTDQDRSRAFEDAYVLGTAPTLLSKKLTGRDVALVQMPGADSDAASGVTRLVEAAGGTITSTLSVTSKAVKPGGRQLVDALISQMAAQNPSLGLPAGLSTYERLGRVIGRSVGASRPRAPYDQTAVGLVAGLQTTSLAKPAAEPTGRAGLVVVLAGTPSQGAVEHDLVAGLAAVVGGVALLGPTPTGPGGSLSLVAADSTLAKKVATIDPADSAAGQAVAVLSLVRLIRGQAGSYGADGADGAVPSLR